MRRAPFKRYVTGLIWLAGGGLAFMALFNAVVNPFNQYDGLRFSGFNDYKYELAKHSRLGKAAEVRRLQPECLILGSSRAQLGLDPQHPGWGNCRSYNLALNGGTLYEAMRYFQHAAAAQKPREVVLALDLLMFNIYRARQQPGYVDERLLVRMDGGPNPDWRSAARYDLFAGLLARETLVASWRTVFPRYARRGRGPEDGFWEYTRLDEAFLARRGQREVFRRNEEAFLTEHWFPAPRHQFRMRDEQRGQGSDDDLRAILRLAHHHEANLSLLISPAHARQWEALDQAGLWSTWETWKRQLVRLNDDEARRAGRATFPLWDFSGFNSYTTEPVPQTGDRDSEMRWYWESSHYRKELGDRVLDVVLGHRSRERETSHDFGVRLDARSVERHLAATRKAHARWREQYPQDVAELTELARRTANWRQP